MNDNGEGTGDGERSTGCRPNDGEGHAVNGECIDRDEPRRTEQEQPGRVLHGRPARAYRKLRAASVRGRSKIRRDPGRPREMPHLA
jgi:hypothetical protein